MLRCARDDHGSIELSPAGVELAEDKGVDRLGVRHDAIRPTRPSSPQEKETEPDGKKLSPNCSTAMRGGHVTHSVHLDLARPQQRLQAVEIVLGRPLHRDQQRARFEPHPPMMVSGAVARLERGIGVPRRDAEPALLRNAQDDRARLVQKKHRPVDQLIAAPESNGDVSALVGLAAQATAQSVVLARPREPRHDRRARDGATVSARDGSLAVPKIPVTVIMCGPPG